MFLILCHQFTNYWIQLDDFKWKTKNWINKFMNVSNGHFTSYLKQPIVNYLSLSLLDVLSIFFILFLYSSFLFSLSFFFLIIYSRSLLFQFVSSFFQDIYFTWMVFVVSSAIGKMLKKKKEKSFHGALS